MVAEIRVYYEGDKALKPGLKKLFGQTINFISSRATESTIADFHTARTKHPAAVVLALVDADCPPDKLDTRVQQLGVKPTDRGSVFFMVQVMEAWFLADREALRQFYQEGFAEKSLPGDPKNIEFVPKDDVLAGLKNATRQCAKGSYSDRTKTNHGPQLFEKLDAARVRRASRNFAAFFDHPVNLVTKTGT